jgi:hypothetical protein
MSPGVKTDFPRRHWNGHTFIDAGEIIHREISYFRANCLAIDVLSPATRNGRPKAVEPEQMNRSQRALYQADASVGKL